MRKVAAVGFCNQVPRTLADAGPSTAPGRRVEIIGSRRGRKVGERSSWWAFSSHFKMRTLLAAVLVAGIASYVFVVKGEAIPQDIAESHLKDPDRLTFLASGLRGSRQVRLGRSRRDAPEDKYAAAHPGASLLRLIHQNRRYLEPHHARTALALPATASAPSDVDDPSQPLPPLPRDLGRVRALALYLARIPGPVIG